MQVGQAQITGFDACCQCCNHQVLYSDYGKLVTLIASKRRHLLSVWDRWQCVWQEASTSRRRQQNRI